METRITLAEKVGNDIIYSVDAVRHHKVTHRKGYAMNIMVIDTETAPERKGLEQNELADNSLVYDFGFCVLDSKTGIVSARGSFVVSDTFNNSNLMNSAYYANKLPQYREGIGFDDNAQWKMVSFEALYHYVRSVVKAYNVKAYAAFNLKFDRTVLNHTTKVYSNGFARYFFPYGLKEIDIWDYASCITGTKKYVRYCIEHSFMTDKGNPKTSAEVVYRYIKNHNDFIEAHTALNDAEIESEIYMTAKRMHKKTRHSVGQGWRDASAIKSAL